MPEMNGLEATKILRKMCKNEEMNSDLVIIINTAFTDICNKEISLEIGANYHCLKPINIKDLYDIFVDYFKNKKNV